MVERFRCKSCGYYHVGPAPDSCPVCGASGQMFVAYEGPGDLTGTKTLENLKAAFAGESQANRMYALFSRIAELEGHDEAKAAFDRALEEETAHALGHLAYMSGFGVTKDNLAKAIAGEDYEYESMYPEFAETAEAEGFSDIAFYFRSVGRFEKEHREEYKDAAEGVGE
ncbi:MAG: ferritin family protein [Anaerosomatales bacterium]|nr:ferritin family protein [Anaerosomatales bacterium]MDT8433732.1 ferritin family protein [Anaerosomatales bacterium]